MRAYRLDQGSEGKQIRLGLRRPGTEKTSSVSQQQKYCEVPGKTREVEGVGPGLSLQSWF